MNRFGAWSGVAPAALLARALGTAFLAAALATAPLAATLAGVTLPDQVTVDGTTLALNGLGLREATFLKVDVYVAGLYLESRSGDAAAILASATAKRLAMQFVRDVKRDELVKAWQHGFEANAGSGMAALKERVDRFDGWMADMKVGDTMSFTWTGGDAAGGVGAAGGSGGAGGSGPVAAKVAVEIKGQATGTIEGSDFGRALLAIWLGDSPPNPELKAGLLGKR